MGEAQFPVLVEKRWGAAAGRELRTDAGRSERPVPTKGAGDCNLCGAEPLVGAPGLGLNKRRGSSFTLKGIKQGSFLRSLHERRKFPSSLAFQMM